MIWQRVLASMFLSVPLLGGCGGADKQASNRVTVKLPVVEPASPARHDYEPQAVAASQTPAAPAATVATVRPEADDDSRYSSLVPSSCEPVGSGDESDDARRRCGGSAGYALETGGGDPLTIISPGGGQSDLDLSKVVPNGALGATAEWRGSGQPRALIVRMNADPPSGPLVSNLVVVKLGAQPCIVGVVPRGPGQNVKARAVADRKLLACRKE